MKMNKINFHLVKILYCQNFLIDVSCFICTFLVFSMLIKQLNNNIKFDLMPLDPEHSFLQIFV